MEKAGELEFLIVVSRDGAPVGSEPVSLGPCTEDALFLGILEGRLPNDGSLPRFGVLPRWKDEEQGTVAALELSCDGAPARSYERSVFTPQAEVLIAALLAENRLAKEDVVDWEVVARKRSGGSSARFSVRLRRSPYPLTETKLAHTPSGAVSVGVTAAVLDGIRSKVVEAGAVECAGLLVGRVLHDPGRSAAAVQALGSVDMKPGREGASRSHFALGPDSFLGVQREATSRDDGMVAVGWWHSHPPCEGCHENPSCRASTVFFSSQDVRVHMSAFGAPYMVALVAGKVSQLPATQPGFRLYAWQNGLVAERELEGIDSNASPDPCEV